MRRLVSGQGPGLQTAGGVNTQAAMDNVTGKAWRGKRGRTEPRN